MIVYGFTFAGQWPVGASGVVVAKDKRAAIKLIKEELKSKGHEQDIESSDVVRIDTKKPNVVILDDGDY